jgi:cytochrome b561
MNPWLNDARRYGRISRALHWIMAAAILGQIGLGLYLLRMTPGLANLWLYGLHKSLGITLLALVVLRLAWHRISPPPAPLGDPRHWTNRLARATHAAIYLLVLVIPISGWIGASASGIQTVLWDRWPLPAIAPATEAWQDGGFLAHALATRLLMALLALHIAGALRRGWAGDGTLTRMTSGRAPSRAPN